MESLYRFITQYFGPFYLRGLLKKRVLSGKEDSERLHERYGQASCDRPLGNLIWIHAASVGESLSVIELIRRLHQHYPQLTVLMTTQTVTSAELVNKRLGHNVIHHYLPYDVPSWIDRFLDHWQPDHAFWVESELWPNLLSNLKKRRVPLTLLNGRLSDRSFKRWKSLQHLIEPPLIYFDHCLVQSQEQKERFEALGGNHVEVAGNIKYASSPLPYDPNELKNIKKMVSGRPVWTVASTHPGEEQLILEAHRKLKNSIPNLLTLLVPRHPSRGDEIASLIGASLIVSRRALGESIKANTDIYLCDTLGELGLFYRAAPIAFVGGSMVPIGGHNIIEPAQVGAAVIHGAYMHNFRDVIEAFRLDEANLEIVTVDDLVATLHRLWSDADFLLSMQERSLLVAKKHEKVLDQVMVQLVNLLDHSFKVTKNAGST